MTVHEILQREVRRYSSLDVYRLQSTLPAIDLAPPPRGPGRPRLIGQSGLSMMLEQIGHQAAQRGPLGDTARPGGGVCLPDGNHGDNRCQSSQRGEQERTPR
ncbi:hypothetical protein SAMN02745117_01644 [Lampropedia hyalina DSM 16112]|jgi:hypothetical protein|uniref:Uncharacterized protein n=1 Tax=Lampropedia hyalina DSM 16112 TaxID=1122156 RepID=A0A1M5ACM4_9BURK|nr:hypothetical protein SAMN02745117_01644 [Lampropedia hyalina DSM 16112]